MTRLPRPCRVLLLGALAVLASGPAAAAQDDEANPPAASRDEPDSTNASAGGDSPSPDDTDSDRATADGEAGTGAQTAPDDPTGSEGQGAAGQSPSGPDEALDPAGAPDDPGTASETDPLDDTDAEPGLDPETGEPVEAPGLESDAEDVVAIEQLDLEQLLSEATVTASGGRSEERVFSSANVYQVSRAQIIAHGWRSLAEILANVPGLYVVDDLVQPSVGVRGVTGGFRAGTRILKLMINGVTVAFRPNLHAFIGPEFIPVEAIERVEIAKGPLSAVYGANAFLATVNVITREPQPGVHASVTGRWMALEPTEGDVTHGFGGGGLMQYGSEDWSALVAFSGERVDRSGLRVRQTFPQQNPELPLFSPFFAGSSERDLSTPAGAYLSLRRTGEDFGTLTLQGGWQQLDAQGDFQPRSVLTHESRYQINNVWSDLRYERPIGDRLQVNGHVGLSHGSPGREEDLFLTGAFSSSYDRNFEYLAIDGGLQASVEAFDDFFIEIGTDVSLEDQDVLYYTQVIRVPQGDRKPGDRLDLIGPDEDRSRWIRTVGVYLGASGPPIPSVPDLRASANVRIDFPNLYSEQYSARASLAYRWSSSFVTKIIVGRAYQTPSAELLFGHTGFGNTLNLIGARTVPGRSLAPQNVLSAEVVATASIAGHLLIDVAAYGQQIQDEIEFVQQSNNFLAQNSGSSENVGVELSTRLELDPVVAYAAGHVQWRTDDDGFTFDPPPLYPNYMLLSGVTARLPDQHLFGNVHVRWVGPRGASQSNVLLNNSTPYELPSYVLLDVTIGTLDLFLLSEESETQLSAGVRNILDSRHSEPGFGGFDSPTLGRNYFVELRQTF